VREKHRAALDSIGTEVPQHDRLCELNVVEQVTHVCQTSIVQGAWSRGQPLAVHGWIYGIGDGLLKDLEICITSAAELRIHLSTPE
jgi:carbonic anhydrase